MDVALCSDDRLTDEYQPHEPKLVRAAKQYIRQHLGSACLSPRSIARAQGISVRHLHRLFRAHGITVGAWVRTVRLARCAADLRDPALLEDTLTEIAFRWGFCDSAQFSRAFRAEFGRTPSDYRVAARGRTPVRTIGDQPWL